MASAEIEPDSLLQPFRSKGLQHSTLVLGVGSFHVPSQSQKLSFSQLWTHPNRDFSSEGVEEHDRDMK